MDQSELEKEFWNFVKCGADMPKQAPDKMLIAYGYYKQATVGDVNTSRPKNSSDIVRTFMYDQWERMKGMSREDAMRSYIDYIRQLFKEQNLKVETFL